MRCGEELRGIKFFGMYCRYCLLHISMNIIDFAKDLSSIVFFNYPPSGFIYLKISQPDEA